MPSGRDERCGARARQAGPAGADSEPIRGGGGEVGLTSLGSALIDALRDDPRYRDIFDDPFGEHEAGGA